MLDKISIYILVQKTCDYGGITSASNTNLVLSKVDRTVYCIS